MNGVSLFAHVATRAVPVSAVLPVVLLLGCQRDVAAPGTAAVGPAAPSFDILDGAHNNGSLHFYFLPPLVRRPSFSGTFDPTQSPEVDICKLASGACVAPLVARFTRDGGRGPETIRVDPGHQAFVVEWRTRRFELDDGSVYRILVLLSGVELGHADVVLKRGRHHGDEDEHDENDEDHRVDHDDRDDANRTDGSFALKLGRTLRIRFRIERGAQPFGHVFIVTEENRNYADVIGNSSMPYLNSLARQYGLAVQYDANTHPSIGNYFMLATGQVIANDDSYSTVVTMDNIVRELLKASKSWKSYAEDLPSVGYTGPGAGRYARKHNVFALLSDVVNDPVQVQNLVPFTQFQMDLANGSLPTFSNIVPNLCNDAHDCPLSTADTWLKNNIAPLISSATFRRDGLLIITFDEARTEGTNGGGRVAWVAVSPKAKRGFRSTTLYQHQNTLRLILTGLGVTGFPGAAAKAADMTEFFRP